MKRYEKLPPEEITARLITMQQLSNGTNIQILRYLYWAKMAFNITVSRALGVTPQLVAKRLKLLVIAGLVKKEKILKNKIYTLRDDRFAELGISPDLFLS